MNLPLHPELSGVAAERFFALARRITALQAEAQGQVPSEWAESEAEWARNSRALNGQAEQYEAAARLLIDLVMLKWRVRVGAGEIELESPKAEREAGLSPDQIRQVKDSLRRELEPVLREQFKDRSIGRFIEEMEAPTPTSCRRSIRLLVADGHEVWERLQPALLLALEQRGRVLTHAVQPYLQLVPDESEKTGVDEFTGIPLGDVWRYFRLTWSIPQTPIPGRQLLYLVRDAAHPCHARMGIAALSNSPMQSGVRDGKIGWSTDAFRKRLLLASSRNDAAELDHCRGYLEQVLTQALEEIATTNLVSVAK